MSDRVSLIAERALATGTTTQRFSAEHTAGLPEPVRRFFAWTLAPGAPLATSARLQMTGQLRLGKRWLPFRAHELLAPHRGFLWAARVAGVVSGSDRYLAGEGRLDWRLLGLLPVVHEDGPDVSRSAAARAAGESVWVPAALLPRCGVRWVAYDDTHLAAEYRLDDLDITLDLRTDRTGALQSVSFDRWGDPDQTGTCGWHRFGMDVDRAARFGEVTLPVEGRVGWHHGTPRWPEGQFFRYRLTRVTPTPPDG